MTNTISRRTLAKGAAWSVPVVAVAASAPSASASPTICTTPTPHTLDLVYHCSADVFGNPTPQNPTYDPQGWKVSVTINLCDTVAVGSVVQSPVISAVVGTPNQPAINTLVGFGATEISAITSKATYTITGVDNEGSRTTDGTKGSSPLVLDGAAVPLPKPTPDTGFTNVPAKGNGQSENVVAAGPIRITIGDFTAKVTHNGLAALNPLSVSCTYASGVNVIEVQAV